MQQAQAQAKEQALFDAASEPFQVCLRIQQRLKPYKGQTTQDANNQREGAAGEIDRLLDMVSNDSNVSPHEWKQILAFALDMVFSGYFDTTVKPKELSKKAKENLITHDPQPASRADMASEGLPRLHAPIQPTCS